MFQPITVMTERNLCWGELQNVELPFQLYCCSPQRLTDLQISLFLEKKKSVSNAAIR